MELLLILIAAGGLVWLLAWAAKGAGETKANEEANAAKETEDNKTGGLGQ